MKYGPPTRRGIPYTQHPSQVAGPSKVISATNSPKKKNAKHKNTAKVEEKKDRKMRKGKISFDDTQRPTEKQDRGKKLLGIEVAEKPSRVSKAL